VKVKEYLRKSGKAKGAFVGVDSHLNISSDLFLGRSRTPERTREYLYGNSIGNNMEREGTNLTSTVGFDTALWRMEKIGKRGERT